MKRILLNLTLVGLTCLSFAQEKEPYYIRLEKFNQGKMSAAEKKELVLQAKSLNEKETAKKVANDYIDNYLLKLNTDDLMSKDNLTFIKENIDGTNSKGFEFFMTQKEKVNAVLGPDIAEYAIRYAIEADYLPKQETKTQKADWDQLEKKLSHKFGELGLEAVYGRQLMYYYLQNDWNNYGKYYKLYLERALKRPEFVINNLSWTIFQNVNDPELVRFACDVVMKYAMEEWYQSDIEAWDTYANLLHKAGRTKEAIAWQEKVVQLKKGQPDEKLYIDALEKMKQGEKTW